MASVSEKATGQVDIAKDRFDLTTFTGRLQHFFTVTSPLTLLASKSQLVEARNLVDSTESQFPKNRRKGQYLVSKQEAEKYWKAQQLVQSSVHPDTGDVVPLPFRMSAFVPTNLLVVGGMLGANTLASTIFWQWANQSLNVLVNYSNAPASAPLSMTEVGTAYVGATSAALGIAIGMTRGVPKLPVSQGTKAILSRLVPFFSVATAGVVNLSFMRYNELLNGIPVYYRDEEGERHKVGESSAAGRRAVGLTAASRILTNIPTLILPPLMLSYLQRKKVVPASGMWAKVADLGLIGTSLLIFLPPALASSPQTATVRPAALEARFHDVKDKEGKPVEFLEFNKGL
ncbi:Sideroflexin FSF1 [Tilletia horrida]|nr:Sideroflexin FSF1 [Tilletia horrida]